MKLFHSFKQGSGKGSVLGKTYGFFHDSAQLRLSHCFQTMNCQLQIFFLAQNAKRGLYKRIWDAQISVNEKNLESAGYGSVMSAVERIRRERYVRIGGKAFTSGFLRRERICDVRLAKHEFFKSSLVFPTYKGFPYLNMFNQV